MINIKSELDVDKIQRELDSLSKELQDKAVKAGVAKVAIGGVKLMRDYAPVDRGTIKNAIRRKKLSKAGRKRLDIPDEQLAVLVGINFKGIGWLGNILDGGAKRHQIKPRPESRAQKFLQAQGQRGKKSTILADGKGLFARKINHPGIKANNFIGRADENLKQKSTGLFYTGVQDYLKRHNKK